MIDPTRAYLKRLAIVFADGLVVVAVFNLFLDPYGAYRNVSIGGLDPFRKNIGSRIGKAEVLRHHACQTIILGTSRAEIGIDPEAAALADTSACNLALSASNMYETAAVFRYAVENSEPRRALLFVNLFQFMFSAEGIGDFDKSRFQPDRSPVDYHFDNLISSRATAASLNVIVRYLQGRPRFTELGFRKHFDQYATRTTTRQRFTSSIRQGVKRMTQPGAFSHRDEQMDQFRDIVRRAKQHQIELIVAIPPVHALYLESIRTCGAWQIYQDWKRELTRVLAQEGATQTVPLWDFTGYRGPVAERLPERDGEDVMHWYWETSHFKSRLGDKVVARMLGDASDTSFGVLLTPENIESHLARIEADRPTWLAQRKGDVEVHRTAAREVFDTATGGRRKH